MRLLPAWQLLKSAGAQLAANLASSRPHSSNPGPCLTPTAHPQGRIFVLAATGGKFQVVCEKETRGAVSCWLGAC